MLAFLLAPVAAEELGPLAVSLSTPETLRTRAIWHVSRLPSGELAVGFEGGLAVGAPGGLWRTIAAPRGQPVRAVAAGHGKVFVAGSGFGGFVVGANLAVVEDLQGEYTGLAVVPEGWLLAGSDGVWWIERDGVARRVLRPPDRSPGAVPRVCQIRDDTVVSVPGEPIRIWREGRLVAGAPPGLAGQETVYLADGDLCLVARGVVDRSGAVVVAESLKDLFLKAGGVVGLADLGTIALVATHTGGLSAYRRMTGERLWNWRPAGEIYGLARAGSGLLVATATGVYSLADPAYVRHLGFENILVRELLAGDGANASVVASAQTYQVGEQTVVAQPGSWPPTGGAEVRDAVLYFDGARCPLRSRYLSGFAAMPDVVAAATSHELVLLTRAGRSTTLPLEGIVGAVATDGRRFLVGTTTRGVYVVAGDGRLVDRVGDGRATVSELRPGKVALLFWEGTIVDSDGGALGRVPDGNPRDAALVPDGLAVLVTRADREPVVGLLRRNEWEPLEIPGLAAVGAEQIAATDSHLFVAGPRGLLRIQLPLAPSRPPPAAWHWSAPVAGREVRLVAAGEETVRVAFRAPDLPPAPATYFRWRSGEGLWGELPPGNPQALAVAWGATPITLQAERNGLVTEAAFTVRRPWPWYLRAWAWPLHALLVGGVVLGWARLRTRRLERRTRELEARVEARTAELRKANAVKEEFLASISHEIRNPLNGVVGICEMLAERKVGPREQMLVRTLGGCADQLRSMLDDILDFSRLERTAPELSNMDFDLVALVEECARVMDPKLAACSLILPEQPCWLHGDSGKLRQIVCNLVSNALKYGVPREAGIEVHTVAAEEGRRRVRIVVRNTGPTIPAAELPLLFESFRRGSHTARTPGSGLGLAVCRRLAKAIGGHLTAASADGLTEFALELVLPSAQPPAPIEPAPATVSRALAIEDESYNRIVLGHGLRALGYAVDWAEDAAAALRLAAANSYDLILTDWRLPDMEGGELCARLLAMLPEPKPPVIAVTGYASTEKLAEAKAAGMSGFITKPVTREKLERTIRSLASGREPRRSLDAEMTPPGAKSPLASLGSLAPGPLQLAGQIAQQWQAVSALAAMQDPRTGHGAHRLRSLLLLAGEESAAEQVGLFEAAADGSDWATVQRLQSFVAEEIAASESRLRS